MPVISDTVGVSSIQGGEDVKSSSLMERPPSPCIKVCELDARGYCTGCLRTGAEIGEWLSMSPARQWQLIAELAQRRQAKAKLKAI